MTSSDALIHVPGAAPALLRYIGHGSKFIAPGRVCPHDRRTADRAPQLGHSGGALMALFAFLVASLG
ncbi:MAG: hypothetical protein WAM03_01000, partial [Pseudolabrys sp.]